MVKQTTGLGSSLLQSPVNKQCNNIKEHRVPRRHHSYTAHAVASWRSTQSIRVRMWRGKFDTWAKSVLCLSGVWASVALSPPRATKGTFTARWRPTSVLFFLRHGAYIRWPWLTITLRIIWTKKMFPLP